jgi:putative ABC transport system permease protein
MLEETVDSFVRGEKIRSSLKRTDGEFWQILDFDFVEGGPFSAEDVDAARSVAVINRTTRQRFFSDAPAVGLTIEAGQQRFRVVGVVEDVSEARQTPFADIWVPITTATSDYRQQFLTGSFGALALARTRSDLPLIQEEFHSRLAQIEIDSALEQMTVVAPLETKFAAWARVIAGDMSPDSQAWKLALLLTVAGFLFALLPAVNLVNINLSRVMERTSEIGVRRAFGASRRALLAQFLFENVILTVVGGLVGLVLAALVLRAFNGSGIVRYAEFAVNVRVFLYGMLIALAFGILSGVYPAWRMARLHPASALRGGERR